MTGYWFRHRALWSIIISVVIAIVTAILFVFPFVIQIADNYNSQSIYKNTKMDFIAPEPSYEQINELQGTNGINKIFPFFITKLPVSIGSKSRTTSVILSDQLDNIDITMYNDTRLIDKSNTEYDNPILVDWQFCKDTSAEIGDTVTFSFGGTENEYQIYAIYETNTIYEGGAILAKISTEQKDQITQNSKSNGYSAMYISASDYNACKTYLTQDYRPMGKLKTREQFESDEQYQIQYDAVMSGGYANEITDFRVRENSFDKKSSPLMLWIGAALSAVLIIAFNVVMAKRGNEKGYFTKHCIPKGQNVKPYYIKSFVCELLLFDVAYAVTLIYKIKFSSAYIPKSALGVEILLIPIAILAAEIISLCINSSMLKSITKKEKAKSQK